MTDEELEIAKELAVHPNFRWLVGMVEYTDDSVFSVFSPNRQFIWIEAGEPCSFGLADVKPGKTIPDISNFATKGCLLELARRVSAIPDLDCENDVFSEETPIWVITSSMQVDRVENGSWPYLTGISSESEGIALARAVMEAPQ